MYNKIDTYTYVYIYMNLIVNFQSSCYSLATITCGKSRLIYLNNSIDIVKMKVGFNQNNHLASFSLNMKSKKPLKTWLEGVSPG